MPQPLGPRPLAGPGTPTSVRAPQARDEERRPVKHRAELTQISQGAPQRKLCRSASAHRGLALGQLILAIVATGLWMAPPLPAGGGSASAGAAAWGCQALGLAGVPCLCVRQPGRARPRLLAPQAVAPRVAGERPGRWVRLLPPRRKRRGRRQQP